MSNLLSQASLVMIPSGYEEDTVYSAIPTDGSGDLSFTRASNGTRVNSAGLVEVVAWNLATNSENFSSWNLANVTVTANDITAPNGTLTADKLTISNNANDVKQTISVMPNSVYTWTFYVYGGTALGQQMRFYDNTNSANIEYYDYSSSVVLGAWVKIERTFTTPSGCYQIQAWVLAATSTIGTMWVWGAQLNIGATAKPYFPTTDRLNVPRLTYQNGGGGCPSLLLEKQSTNLALYSEQFDDASWTKARATITANATTSPDGTTNADKFIENTANDSHAVLAAISNTSGQQYAVTIYAKASERNWFLIYVGGGPAQGKFFNLSNGTLGSVLGNAPNDSSIINVGNGWYRCSITYTATDASSDVTFQLATSDGTNSYTGDGTSGLFIWGAQVEASSYPTSYIPTTSSSATRVADTYQKAGIGNTSTAGTLYYEFSGYQPFAPANGLYMIQLFAGSSVGDAFFCDANSISIVANGANIEGRNNGYSTTLFTFAPTTATVKVALRYDGTNVVAFLNGVKQTVYSDTAVGVKNAFRVNNGENGTHATKELVFFPIALTDAECIALTTI